MEDIMAANDQDHLVEMRRILQVLPKLAAKLPADLDEKSLTGAADDLEKKIGEVKRLNALRTEAMNLRDDAVARINDLTKRVRAAVKGAYGDDSTEYELVGGTRLSDRKRPVRKNGNGAPA